MALRRIRLTAEGLVPLGRSKHASTARQAVGAIKAAALSGRVWVGEPDTQLQPTGQLFMGPVTWAWVSASSAPSGSVPFGATRLRAAG